MHKQWRVTFTQKDKPSNSFTQTYDSEEEYLMWANLHHKTGFTVEVEEQTVEIITVATGFYPDVVPVSEQETFRCNDCGEDILVSEMCGEWDDLCASCNSEREEQDDE